jgi:tRNA(Ile)-lysidine synthase
MEVGSNLPLVKAESKALLSARVAVRRVLAEIPTGARVGVAVSGGADSMALAVATHLESKARAHHVVALIVDHKLQSGSEVVARNTAKALQAVGIEDVEILEVDVEIRDGLESSARRARYGALEKYARDHDLTNILLGHTKNDQAETVLLGLARGSGTRSLSGMAVQRGIFLRPLLGIDRSTTVEVCDDLGIEYWRDPQNDETTFTRVRVRRLLPELDREIGPGIVDALSRSAELLRDDADALDLYAMEFFKTIDPSDIDLTRLASLPRAVRTRVLRMAIYALGAPEGSLGADHIAPIEALVSEWHGQGPSSLPGGVKVERKSGRLSLSKRG